MPATMKDDGSQQCIGRVLLPSYCRELFSLLSACLRMFQVVGDPAMRQFFDPVSRDF